MIIQVMEVLILVIFASILQKNYKIPSPITIMSVVMTGLYFDVELFDINSKQFDDLVLITLPLLIASDALKLKLSDIKEHGASLFWVAVISVLMFIGVGVLINNYILINYPLSIAAVILLFCMVAATDPITVSAVFSNFKVPHKLNVITEGESLFNDATALIVFSLALIALKNPSDVTPSLIVYKSFSVVAGAIAVGMTIGFINIWLLKFSQEALVEAIIIILAAYSSYWVAEHFHFSGILSVIATILMANNSIQKIISEDDIQIAVADKTNNLGLLKYAITNKDNHETILKNVEFLSVFASTVLFASIASVVNFEKLWYYKYEILAVFIASTIIRGVMMLKFALISNNVSFMQNIRKHWWAVLTFAGSKGALSILMVHMLPSTFQYKSLFENIIVGNILLSTFVYAITLAFIFKCNKQKFEEECEQEFH